MESTTGNTTGIPAGTSVVRTLTKTVTNDRAAKPRVSAAARMAKLARLARARGFLWTAFYNLYAAAVVEGDNDAGFQLAEVLLGLRPTHALSEIDEAFLLALSTPWARPATLTRAIVDYLLLDRRVERLAEDVTLSLDDLDAAAAHLANNELFASLLQTSIASDLRLERVLVQLRDHLLAVAPATPGAMRLTALIATQAHMMEYLWPYSVGPIDLRTNAGGCLAPVTAARALLNSMFRQPNATEIRAIESIAADPTIACLLERVRDEPALLTRNRDELERAAVSLGTVAVEPQSGPKSCQRWIKEPTAARRLPLAVRRRLRTRNLEGSEVLVAGCGSGQDLFSICATYPKARVTALDTNTEKLAYAARRCTEAGIETITFLPGSLLDVPPLGWTFGVVECLGLQRHVPDADFGCEALARCMRPGSLLRLAVFSDATCRVVGALRRSASMHGVTRALSDVKQFRAELLEGRHGALPPALLQSADFYTVSGLRDLLFADEQMVLGTSAWHSMLDWHGFDFVCEEVNGNLVRAARAAGFQTAPLWSIRDCKRFEREHPFAFGGTQFLWFERRASRR
jgi:SAM-dependent methyltransferase